MEITSNQIQNFLNTVEENRKNDVNILLELFEAATNLKPKMWGSIVGYGNLHYVYPSKRQGNMPIIGFANRKQALTLYLSNSISDNPLLEELGKHKTSNGRVTLK